MHGSVVRPYPLLPPTPIVVLRGDIERTTTAHATAFEGSGVRSSGFDSRASPRRDHRPLGSGDEQALITRSFGAVKEGVAGELRASGYLPPSILTAA